jgi:hypothetical protein
MAADMSADARLSTRAFFYYSTILVNLIFGLEFAA